MGRFVLSGLMKLFLWHAPQLSGVSILFFPSPAQNCTVEVATVADDLMATPSSSPVVLEFFVHRQTPISYLQALVIEQQSY